MVHTISSLDWCIYIVNSTICSIFVVEGRDSAVFFSPSHSLSVYCFVLGVFPCHERLSVCVLFGC